MPREDPKTSQNSTPFGLWSATFLVVANMIGAGVFTTSGFSFADLGDRQCVMLAWLIGSLVAICGAISYGQLAQRITESGGEYLFLSRMLHPAIGFVAGWVSLLAGFTGAIAFAATAFETYAIPDSIRPAWFQSGLAGITAIFFFGLLHSIVLKTGLITQNAVVILKLVLLCLFVTLAFSCFPNEWAGMQITTDPVPFSIYALASTLVWISLSFSGFNAAVYITGEVESPRKNVPRSLLIGTVLVSLIYFALNFIFIFCASPEQIRDVRDVAATASQAVGGDRLAIMIRVIVSVALLSSVSSMVVAGPRVYAKMAEDGLFPNLFSASKGKEHRVPVTAIWLQVVLASIVVYFSSLESLLDYLGFTLSVSAAITVACIFWTRRANDTKVHHVFFSAIALLYVAATVVLAILSAINRPQQLIGFVVTVLSGLILFYVSRAWVKGRGYGNCSR